MRRRLPSGAGWVAAAALAALAACAAPPGSSPDAAPAGDGAGPDAPGGDAPVPGFAVQYADPDHGPFSGGTRMLVRGSGFREDDQVWIGGRLVLDQEFIDSRRFEVIGPPGEPGPSTIEVRRTGDTASRDGAFTFDALAVDPPGGSVAGGTYVTITGYGTDFDAGTVVRFDGVPLTGVTVDNAQRLRGYTPPGVAGDADVLITSATTTWRAARGYTYFTTGDPFSGGFSGPPLAGSINVVVIDIWTKDGIPGAFVAVGDPNTTPYKGYTDALGQITFSGADLVGPQVVTAWAAEHEVATFYCVDSQNVTFWLRSPVPPPDNGPPPNGVMPSTIRGHVMFGDATGLGSPFWDLVPEPRTPTERKRIYVTAAAPYVTGLASPYVAPIDYTGPDRLAWSYEVSTWAGARAVVAVAGLYDPEQDPTGQGSMGFEGFAVGVARGVLVGPGETRDGVDIVVNVPMDSALRVQLDNPPALGTPGWLGPDQLRMRAGVELGGEGVVHLRKPGLWPDLDGLYPGEYVFEDGQTAITLTNVPALVRSIADGSYEFHVGAYSGNGGTPMSVKIARGLTDVSEPITIGGFIGVPRAIDPPPAGVATGRHLIYANEAPASGTATFHLHMLSDANGEPVWRAVACGGLQQLDMPDLSSIGVDWPPHGETVAWTAWSIEAAAPYQQFNYRWFGSLYWRAYAAASYPVQFP